MTLVRTPIRTQMREAAVTMLTDFRQAYDLKLQVYPARPRSINPPCAFVDRIREAITFDGLRSRVLQVDVVVLHGMFDNKEAADNGDFFVDNFIDWASDHFHAAGPSTGLEPRATEDDPNYVPDWLPPEGQLSYYATTITLEGFAGAGM